MHYDTSKSNTIQSHKERGTKEPDTYEWEAARTQWKSHGSAWIRNASKEGDTSALWNGEVRQVSHAHHTGINVDDEECTIENTFSTASTNEECKGCGKGKLVSSDHNMIAKQDNTESQLQQNWVESAPSQTSVRVVKKYREWQIKNGPGGPVWYEYQVHKEDTSHKNQ